MPKKKAKKKPKKKAKKKPKKKIVKKASKKKKAAPASAKKPLVLPWRQPLSGETFAGVVEDYFGKIGVIALTLKRPLALGDRIHVHGHTTDLISTVGSMQIGHQPVERAGVGDSVGISVGEKCRKGDYVFYCAS